MQAQVSDRGLFQLHARWLTTHVGMSPKTTNVHAPRTLDSTQNRCAKKHALVDYKCMLWIFFCLVRKMGTGFNTAEEGCEVRAAAALQA